MKSARRAVGTLVVTTSLALVGAGMHAEVATAAPSAVAGPARTGLIPVPVPGVLSFVTGSMLSGTPQVGSPLSMTTPTWNLAGVSTTFSWLSDRNPITGATDATYTPTAADVGHTISGLATGTLLGQSVPSATGGLLILPAAGGGGAGTLVPTSLPVISGVPQVGQVLTVTDPVWNLPGVTTTTQWLRDGLPIPGATGSTYDLVPADGGHTVSTQVTGLLGTLSSQATSSPVAVLLGAAPVFAGRPTISGRTEVGQRLTADPGTTAPAATTYVYQWQRGGVAIPGATGATYVTRAADAAKKLTVQVSTQLLGFEVARATSDPTTIKKLSSAVRVTTRPTIKKGAKAVLRLTVSTNGGAPTGRIRVADGRRLLASVRLPASASPTKVVRLVVKGLRVGTHRLRAAYAGDASTKPSRSPVTVVTVKKPTTKHRHH